MSHETECALRGVRATVPIAVPTLLSAAVASSGGWSAAWGGVFVAVLAAGALVLRGRGLVVLVVCSALAVLSPVLYGATGLHALAQLTLTALLAGPMAAALWTVRHTVRGATTGTVEATSRFAVSVSGDQRHGHPALADAGLRQLGFTGEGPQASPARILANGRFTASSAERTAATDRSPRDSAEPT